MAKARYSRRCPTCQKYIFVGAEVTKQRIDKKIVWVHKECWKPMDYMKSRLAREIKQLDNDFKKTIEKKHENPHKRM